MTRSALLLATAAALTLAGSFAAGCSGDDPSEPTGTGTVGAAQGSPSPASPHEEPTVSAGGASDRQDELQTAVTAYSDAFLTGDGATAYALLSERCKDRLPEPRFTAEVQQAGQLYGSALPLESYHAEVSGDLARVTYTYSVSAINQDREPWVRESGQWREDDC